MENRRDGRHVYFRLKKYARQRFLSVKSLNSSDNFLHSSAVSLLSLDDLAEIVLSRLVGALIRLHFNRYLSIVYKLLRWLNLNDTLNHIFVFDHHHLYDSM